MNRITKEFKPIDNQPVPDDMRDRYARQKVCLAPDGEHFYGCWFPPDIHPTLGDILYTVPRGRQANWPLISFKFYKTTRLDWFIHEASKFLSGVPENMMEPMEDMTTIVIPEKAMVQKLIAGDLNG